MHVRCTAEGTGALVRKYSWMYWFLLADKQMHTETEMWPNKAKQLNFIYGYMLFYIKLLSWTDA